jgi:hypothetical protein
VACQGTGVVNVHDADMVMERLSNTAFLGFYLKIATSTCGGKLAEASFKELGA